MSVNRYNYQEFFLLYTDNELKPEEKKAVEDFVLQNPDLKEELMMLQQAVLRPDQEIVFNDKEILMEFGNAGGFIHPGNFEEFAIAYNDNELNNTEKTQLEEFVRSNPDFQKEFDLLRSLQLPVDASIVFPGKEELYRYENRKPVMLPWWRMAAAAIVLISAGLLWLGTRQDNGLSSNLARLDQPVLEKKSNKSFNKTTVKDQPVTNTLKIQPGIPGDPAAQVKNGSVASSGGQSIHKQKNRIPAVKNIFNKEVKSKEESVTIEKDANNNQVDGVAVKEEQTTPESTHPASKSQNKLQNLAALDASIEMTHQTIAGRPAIVVGAASNGDNNFARTVADTDDDENISVSGIPLDKKSPLRGILRKASRFIDKNTSSRTSKKSGLLIGNVEIAFQ